MGESEWSACWLVGSSCWSASGNPFGSMAISSNYKRSSSSRRVPHVEICRWHNNLWSCSPLQAQHSTTSGWFHSWLVPREPSATNPVKYKEICMCFKCTPPCFSQLTIEGVEFEIVSSTKVLGVVISSNLKWSVHIDSITAKAAKILSLKTT